MTPRKITAHIAKKETRTVPITTEFIRLDAALKLANAVSTGGQAKLIITEGDVRVNGEVCLSRGKKLHEGDRFLCNGIEYEVRKAEDRK